VRVTLFDYIVAIGDYFKADVTVNFDRLTAWIKSKWSDEIPGVTQWRLGVC